MTLHYASQYTWNFEAQPWNGYVALEEFVNSYEAGDDRRKANFIAGPQLDYGGNALVDLASDSPTPEIVYSIGINENASLFQVASLPLIGGVYTFFENQFKKLAQAFGKKPAASGAARA